MEERIHLPPFPAPHGRYLIELLIERQNLQPFEHMLPICTMLLTQEISRVSVVKQLILDHQIRDGNSPLRYIGQPGIDMEGQSGLPVEGFTYFTPVYWPPPYRGNTESPSRYAPFPLPPPPPPIARPTFRPIHPGLLQSAHAPFPPTLPPSRVTTHSLFQRPNMHQN